MQISIFSPGVSIDTLEPKGSIFIILIEKTTTTQYIGTTSKIEWTKADEALIKKLQPFTWLNVPLTDREPRIMENCEWNEMLRQKVSIDWFSR